MKVLVDITERKWIEENASKLVGKDNGLKIKVLDMPKITARIKKEFKGMKAPYITIRPISEDMHKSRSNTSAWQKDPVTGVYYGILTNLDDFGNPRWQKINIGDSLTLDMSVDSDVQRWAVLRFHPQVKGSPFSRETPYYKIDNPIENAKNQLKKSNDIKMALEKASKLEHKPKEAVAFLRFLGIDLMENSNIEIINGLLVNEAIKNPDGFLTKWDSKARSLGELFFSAKAVGVVSYNHGSGYTFGDIVLGSNEKESILRMAKDSGLATAIKTSTEDKDKLTVMLLEEYKESEKMKSLIPEQVIDDEEL